MLVRSSLALAKKRINILQNDFSSIGRFLYHFLLWDNQGFNSSAGENIVLHVEKAQGKYSLPFLI